LVAEFGPSRDGWWRLGVPEQERVHLAGEQERQGLADPWQLITIGSMQKIIDANKQAVARVTRQGSVQPLKADADAVKQVRNAVMHPVKALTITESDFVLVRSAVQRLRGWVDVARDSGSLVDDHLPAESELLASPASMGDLRA
jgi:hypothetical protein